MTKDKKLQIRVSTEEMSTITQRAREAGLPISEYGRQLLLGKANPALATMTFEDPGLSREEILAPDDPKYTETVRKIASEHNFPLPEWKPEIPGRNDCNVKDVPPGVRCIKCGELHGS